MGRGRGNGLRGEVASKGFRVQGSGFRIPLQTLAANAEARTSCLKDVGSVGRNDEVRLYPTPGEW
jgi:hypothetical protein